MKSTQRNGIFHQWFSKMIPGKNLGALTVLVMIRIGFLPATENSHQYRREPALYMCHMHLKKYSAIVLYEN
jgi:hypothetical protein